MTNESRESHLSRPTTPQKCTLQKAFFVRITMKSFILLLLSLVTATDGFSKASNNAPLRWLEEAVSYGDDYNAAYQYDLSQFSVRFERCQYVKMYDDELAEDENSDSPLALRHFVVFRLCPTDSCEVCDDDNDDEDVPYGIYTVSVQTYLERMVNYEMEIMKNKCEGCNDEECNDDAGNCNSCPSECSQYQNLDGYVDASNYIECQQLEVQNNGDAGEGNNENENQDDGSSSSLYIGPRCNQYGKIVIGLFSDQNCWDPIDDLDVETVLGAKLSYMYLSQPQSEDGGCVSCKEDDENENENDKNDADDVNEMCEELYNDAAKCESKTGIEVGFIQTNREDGDYENQVENEFMACTFIESILANSYTEEGEINYRVKQDVIVRYVTQKQALSLSFLAVTIGALFLAIFLFDRKIKEVEDSRAGPFLLKGGASLT